MFNYGIVFFHNFINKSDTYIYVSVHETNKEERQDRYVQ